MSLAKRFRFTELLSPDLLRLFEQAERAAEDGLVEKAFRLYERIVVALPDNEELSTRVSELRATSRRSKMPVAGFDDEERATTITLLRELGLEQDAGFGYVDLAGDLGAIESLPADRFASVGLMAAVTAGLSGDWALSERFVERLEREAPSTETKLWRLRTLVELERFTEALAMVNSVRWKPAQLVAVNYLAGLALESLGLTEQARQRFDAVRKADPKYRGIAEKFAGS